MTEQLNNNNKLYNYLLLISEGRFLSHGIKNSKIREGGQESKMRVYIGDMLLGESRQTQVNSCPEFLGRLVMWNVEMKR